MMLSIGRLVVLSVLLVVFAPEQGSAQADTAQSPPVLRNVISANPLLLMFGWTNAEYERMVSSRSTIGLRGSTLSFDINLIFEDEEVDSGLGYSNARVFWRYYPRGAFKGIYLGLDAGVTSLGTDDRRAVPAAGFDIGYTVLTTAQRKFYISFGAGADRLFSKPSDGLADFFPNLRIVNLGFAF